MYILIIKHIVLFLYDTSLTLKTKKGLVYIGLVLYIILNFIRLIYDYICILHFIMCYYELIKNVFSKFFNRTLLNVYRI